MLKSVFLASAITLSLAAGAGAQQQPAPSGQSQTQQAPSTGVPQISNVAVVDVDQLPAETKSKVDEYVAKQGEEGLKKLRASVDSTPEAKSALEQKGMTSAEVIAASLGNDGTLTLITKKKAS
jgi:hypothetical protein